MRTLIVDDEPWLSSMQILCARIPALQVVGTAADGAAALRLVEALAPDLVMLDMTMPELDGLGVARALARQTPRPAVIFVTAHDHFAVEAFDCEAVDYVLKPQDRLERAVERALALRPRQRRRHGCPGHAPACPVACPVARRHACRPSPWIEEFWVPHRSELVRVAATDIDRIDAERDYVRLHVGQRSYLMLHTIQRLEAGSTRRASSASTAPPSSGATGFRACATMGWGLVRRTGRRHDAADRADLSGQGQGHGGAVTPPTYPRVRCGGRGALRKRQVRA
jgi:two-component system response regulator AlgR